MGREREIMRLTLDMLSVKFHLDLPVELSSRQKEQSLEKVQTWDHMCTQRPVELLDVA